MAAPIPTTEPASITAGDTAKWTLTLQDYPASAGWSLAYTLVNSAGRIVINAAASGDDHAVVVAASTSAAYAPGVYDWRAQASKAGEVFTVRTGRINIAPAWGSATDGRSKARIILEAVEDTIAGRATSATAEYEIAGRKLKYIPLPELLQLRDRCRQDVAREDRAAGLMPQGGRIQVRFGA